jgi:predicted site-specific integrase-resolvase
MTEAVEQIEIGATSMTIKEWCRVEGIAESTFHKWQKQGIGPAIFNPPGTRTVRIVESRESYHARMMKRAATRAAKREHKRRAELAKRAAKISAASPNHASKTQKARNAQRAVRS